jgi:hypothetical protein
MQVKEAPQHCEVGVFYSFETYPNVEPVTKGMQPYDYTWKHVPSGKTGCDTVYLWHESHLARLCKCWSRTAEWQYSPA